jgi:hypothetical protein
MQLPCKTKFSNTKSVVEERCDVPEAFWNSSSFSLLFVVHKQVIMMLQVKCSELKSRGVGLFIITLTERSSSFKASRRRSR